MYKLSKLVFRHVSVKIIGKWFLSKAKSFASGQKPCTSGLQVNKTLRKWLASDLQVVQNFFAIGLLASKPMQILSKLVCFRSSNINVLEMPQLASTYYLMLPKFPT